MPDIGKGDYTKIRQQWDPSSEVLVEALRLRSKEMNERGETKGTPLVNISEPSPEQGLADDSWAPPEGQGDYTKARRKWNPSEEEVIASLKKRSPARKRRKAS